MWAASSGILTTSGGTIVDASGDEVILKGYALSGMEIGHTISGDPTEGTNSINKDWLTNMYRWASQCVMGPWHQSAVWLFSAGSGPQLCWRLPGMHRLLVLPVHVSVSCVTE